MVDSALQALLEEGQTITAQGVKEWIGCSEDSLSGHGRPGRGNGLVEF